ncbi:MAG: polyprenyl synthetase family protein [Rickettsiales bacterium]
MTTNVTLELQEAADMLYDCMDALLPEASESPEGKLFAAMRYSALAPGKRLRPFLTIKSAEIFGVSRSSALRAAASIEFVHAYSLIHDDLPCMDNDDVRRGQPSCHKKFDEATALLAGDALLSLAFEVVSDPQTHNSNATRCELVRHLAKAAGGRGMVGGQMIDIQSETVELDVNQVINLQRLKTGALFSVSCEFGALLGNAAPNLRQNLRAYANDLGLAFQMTDDIIDAAEDAPKKGRVNKSEHKKTLIGLMGREKVLQHCRMLTEQAVNHLRCFGKKADILREMAEHIGARVAGAK